MLAEPCRADTSRSFRPAKQRTQSDAGSGSSSCFVRLSLLRSQCQILRTTRRVRPRTGRGIATSTDRGIRTMWRGSRESGPEVMVTILRTTTFDAEFTTGYDPDSPMPGLEMSGRRNGSKGSDPSKIQLARSVDFLPTPAAVLAITEPARSLLPRQYTQEFGVTFTYLFRPDVSQICRSLGLLSERRPHEILVIEESAGIPVSARVQTPSPVDF